MDSRRNITRRDFLGTTGRAVGVGVGALALGGIESVVWQQAALARGGGGAGVCPTSPGVVHFPTSEIISSNASAADQTALVNTIVNSWTRYLATDAPGTVSFMTSDITRLCGRWGAETLQQGSAKVQADLPFEWAASEFAGGKPANGLAQEFFVKRAAIDVDPSGNFATVNYWVHVDGGFRWCFSDLGWVLQAFTKVGGVWKIAHQIDGWSSDISDLTTMTGAELFRFDYFSPVTNLTRAVNFYTPFLGTPEVTTVDQATWVNFRNSRFVLDASRLGGVVTITNGFPNGWGTIYTSDVTAERNRLKTAGVQFIAGTDTTLKTTAAGDQYAIGLDDPVNGANNIFVIMQQNYATTGASPATPSGFNLGDTYQAASSRLATAWVKQDTATITTLFGTSGAYYDDTRNRAAGLVTGGSKVAASLTSKQYPRYDRGAGGLSADIVASSVSTRNIGSKTIVSYKMTLNGTGTRHPFHETVLATDVFDASQNVVFMVRVASSVDPAVMVRSLDYSGVPCKFLPGMDTFYSTTMRFGVPYVDVAYRGWWSDNQSVYGTYKSNPTQNQGLPRAGMANGYLSLWVPSAQKAFDQLKAQGAGFPYFPAINGQPGIDPNPGYIQVLFSDSEGNDNVVTEYTGT